MKASFPRFGRRSTTPSHSHWIPFTTMLHPETCVPTTHMYMYTWIKLLKSISCLATGLEKWSRRRSSASPKRFRSTSPSCPLTMTIATPHDQLCDAKCHPVTRTSPHLYREHDDSLLAGRGWVVARKQLRLAPRHHPSQCPTLILPQVSVSECSVPYSSAAATIHSLPIAMAASSVLEIVGWILVDARSLSCRWLGANVVSFFASLPYATSRY